MSTKASKRKKDITNSLFSMISEDYIENILKKTFDAVFFFDVPNDMLICQHIREPFLSELLHIRMVLKDAIQYWLDNLIEVNDRAILEEFIKNNVYSGVENAVEKTLEFAAHTRNGQQKYYTSILYPLGEGKYLFCCRDITSTKIMPVLLQNNAELKKQNADNEKYGLALGCMGFAVVECDHINNTFNASPAYGKYAVSRYDPRLIGQNFDELSGVYKEDLPRFLDFYSESSGQQTTAEITVRIRTVDGEYRWTKITVINHKDNEGHINKTIGILCDVDELVQAKITLAKNKERFAQIINNILEGVVIFRLDGDSPRFLKLQYVSDKALRFYGIEAERYREEISSGKTPDEVIHNRLLSNKELNDLILDGEVSFSRTLPESESLRYFEAICSVEKNEDSAFYYTIIRETTSEHENRERIEWQQEKYRMICQGSDIVTFDYDVNADELVYSFNIPPHGYQEEIVPSFLENIEVLTLFREAQLHEFKNYINAVLHGETVEEFEILLNLHRHGFEWYAMQLFGVKDETGSVYRIIGKTQSIQKAKDHMMKRLRSEAVVQIALSSDALFSAAFNTVTGEKVSITGEVFPDKLNYIKNSSQLFEYLKANVHPDDLELILLNIVELDLLSPDNSARKQKFECRFHTDNSAPGEYRWIQVTYMHAFNEIADCEVVYFFVMDIDEEKRHLLHFMEQTNIDHTTKFLNRTALENYCASERDNQQLSNSTNALVILEVKFEDEISGYEGIQRIERTAAALAKRIWGWAGKDDRPARFNDTKYLICMHGLENMTALRERVESLRKILNQFEQESIGISVYMGVTRCCHDYEEGYCFVYNQAESALLKAKESGTSWNVFHIDTLGQQTEIIKRRQAYIRTFGYFEVFVNQKPVFFKSAKAKELLAILVDRRSSYLSADEAIGYLWENEPANKVTRSRYRKVAMRLKETLEEHGIGDIIEVNNRKRRIVMEKVQCDLFDYISGKEGSYNTFSGSYMLDYSWAEVSSAQLNKRYWTL